MRCPALRAKPDHNVRIALIKRAYMPVHYATLGHGGMSLALHLRLLREDTAAISCQ